MVDVSIIYVNYHTSALIADSLQSVFDLTTEVDYEIIVVDNDSEPDLQDKLSASFPDQEIKCILLDENVGFGRANNAGARIAQGRYLFYLNPDTVLVNNAVRILSDFLDRNPETGAVGGNLYDEGMLPMLSFRRLLPGIQWELNELFHHLPERIRYGRNLRFNFGDEPLEVGYVSGADMMVRSKIENELKGFSPEFFMYYEETDYCARIRKLGYNVMSVPSAKIKHLEGGSFENAEINENRLRRSEVSRLTYYHRNVPVWQFRISNVLYHLFLKSRVILNRSEGYRMRLKIFKTLTIV